MCVLSCSFTLALSVKFFSTRKTSGTSLAHGLCYERYSVSLVGLGILSVMFSILPRVQRFSHSAALANILVSLFVRTTKRKVLEMVSHSGGSISRRRTYSITVWEIGGDCRQTGQQERNGTARSSISCANRSLCILRGQAICDDVRARVRANPSVRVKSNPMQA